jgi:hypothetical protein
VDTPGETELYYSFDWQGIHFIFLNVVEDWDGDNYTCPTAQMDWLLSDFESNDLEFIVVSFHNPMYSIRAERPDRWAQGESLRVTFQTLFVDNGVDIVFNGHDHMYYRTDRGGIQYSVTGGGGAPLCDFEIEGTVYQEGDVVFSDYHYCVCSINNVTNELTVEVFLMDETTPVDEFSLQIPTQPTQPAIPIEMIVVVLSAVVVVIVVLVLFVRKRR